MLYPDYLGMTKFQWIGEAAKIRDYAKTLEMVGDGEWRVAENVILELDWVTYTSEGQTKWNPIWRASYRVRCLDQVISHTNDGIIPEPI